MAEIIDDDGKIDYNLALNNLKTFLYGRSGEIDIKIRLRDLSFYRRNLWFVLRSLSLPLISKILSLWRKLGYKTVRRYFQLNVLAVLNKLKEREKAGRG